MGRKKRNKQGDKKGDKKGNKNLSPKLRISTIEEERDFKGGAFPYVILNRFAFMFADDWVIRMGRLGQVFCIRNGERVTVAPYFTASPSGDGRVYGTNNIMFDGTERWACARAVFPLSSSITYPPSEERGEIATGERGTYVSNIDGREYEYFGFYYGSKPKYRVSGDMSNLLEQILRNNGDLTVSDGNVKRVYSLKHTGRIFPRSNPRNQCGSSNSDIWALEIYFGVELDKFSYRPNDGYSAVSLKEFEIYLNGKVMTGQDGTPLKYVCDIEWEDKIRRMLFYTVEGIVCIRYTEKGVPDHTKDAVIAGVAMLPWRKDAYQPYYGDFDATEMNRALSEMAEVCFPHNALQNAPCDITIPHQMRVVPEMEYWGMNARSFTIPETVVEIGVGAFAGNPDLERLDFHNGTFYVPRGQNVFKVERYGNVWIVCSSTIFGEIHVNAVSESVPTEIFMNMLKNKDYKIREYAISQVKIDDDNLEEIFQMLSKEKEGGVIAKFLQREIFRFDYEQLTLLYGNRVFIRKLKRYLLIGRTPLQDLLILGMNKYEQFREPVLSLQNPKIYPNPNYTDSDLTETMQGQCFNVEFEVLAKSCDNIPYLIAKIFDKTVEEKQCQDQYEIIAIFENKNWKIVVKGNNITILSPVLQCSNCGELEAILKKLFETEVIDTQAEDIGTQTEVIDTQTKSIGTQTEVIDTQTEVIDTQTKSIDTKTKSIYTKTKDIYTQTKSIYTKTKGPYTKTKVVYTSCFDFRVRFIVTKFDDGPGLQSAIARVLTNFYINQGILRKAFEPLKNFLEFDEERVSAFASAKDSKERKGIWYNGVTKRNRGESYNETCNYTLDFHGYYIDGVVGFKFDNSTWQEGAVEAFVNFASAILSASISMYNIPPILRENESPRQSTDEFLRNIGLKGDEFARTRQTITGPLSDEPISPEELGAYEAKRKKYQSKL